jgi:hypothetical protein
MPTLTFLHISKVLLFRLVVVHPPEERAGYKFLEVVLLGGDVHPSLSVDYFAIMSVFHI